MGLQLVVSPVSDEGKGGELDLVIRTRSKKAPNAFRTISEVADDLHIPQHVLRFWETKFPQVKPLKRGGGRRYYRPDDIDLLRRIADLLYTQGYTIKGVQRLLREGGGQLSDNIPPPTADERAEAAVEKAPLAIVAPPLAGGALELVPLPVILPLGRTEDRQAGTERDDLRELLREALQELEAIRALLGQAKRGSQKVALKPVTSRPGNMKLKA